MVEIMIPKFLAKKEKQSNRLKLLDQDKYSEYCSTLAEGDYFITIKSAKEKEIRSNNQNRYYFGVVLKLISEHTGYNVEECHELMKVKFNYKMLAIKDILVRIPMSTTELKTDKMEHYLSEIRMWASKELSIFIPLPNEVEAY